MSKRLVLDYRYIRAHIGYCICKCYKENFSGLKMSINKIKVLLCTGVSSETDNNENQYKKCLTEHGFECEILQVLHFEFINLDDLRNSLLDSEYYSGKTFLINTSNIKFI